MNLDECYGLGTTHDDDHAAAIGAITRENCQRTARRLIRLDSYSEALLSP